MKVRIQVGFNIDTEDFETVAAAIHDTTGRVKRFSENYSHGNVGNIRILGNGSASDDEKETPNTSRSERAG